MSQQQVGLGSGYLYADTEKRKYLANGTVTKGDVVGFVLSGTDGYTVDQCTTTTIPPIGVAAETGTDVWIDVIVSGHCNFVTNNGTDVVAGDMLVGGAGVAIPQTLAEAQADGGGVGWLGQIFGQSLEAETSTTCTNCIIYKRV